MEREYATISGSLSSTSSMPETLLQKRGKRRKDKLDMDLDASSSFPKDVLQQAKRRCVSAPPPSSSTAEEEEKVKYPAVSGSAQLSWKYFSSHTAALAQHKTEEEEVPFSPLPLCFDATPPSPTSPTFGQKTPTPTIAIAAATKDKVGADEEKEDSYPHVVLWARHLQAMCDDNDRNFPTSTSTLASIPTTTPYTYASQLSDPRVFTCDYNQQFVPFISIHDYLVRLFRFSCMSESVVLVAAHYMWLLSQTRPELRLSSRNVHRLVFATCVVAGKFQDDFYYSNAFLARVGGVSLQDVNRLEVAVICILKYDLGMNKTLGALRYRWMEESEPGTDWTAFLQRQQHASLLHNHPHTHDESNSAHAVEFACKMQFAPPPAKVMRVKYPEQSPFHHSRRRPSYVAAASAAPPSPSPQLTAVATALHQLKARNDRNDRSENSCVLLPQWLANELGDELTKEISEELELLCHSPPMTPPPDIAVATVFSPVTAPHYADQGSTRTRDKKCCRRAGGGGYYDDECCINDEEYYNGAAGEEEGEYSDAFDGDDNLPDVWERFSTALGVVS